MTLKSTMKKDKEFYVVYDRDKLNTRYSSSQNTDDGSSSIIATFSDKVKMMNFVKKSPNKYFVAWSKKYN